MAKKLWSLSGIASETGRNFRTIAKAMADLKPDAKVSGQPRWHMATALNALADHERRTGRVQHRHMPERYDPELEAKIAAIEAATEAVAKLLEKLRATPTVELRRELVEAGEAKCIGALERGLTATIGDGSDAFLRRLFANEQMSFVMNEVCDLCEWSISSLEAQ
jgi:hypothetical protein